MQNVTLTDRQVADKLGISVSQVKVARTQRNLKIWDYQSFNSFKDGLEAYKKDMEVEENRQALPASSTTSDTPSNPTEPAGELQTVEDKSEYNLSTQSKNDTEELKLELSSWQEEELEGRLTKAYVKGNADVIAAQMSYNEGVADATARIHQQKMDEIANDITNITQTDYSGYVRSFLGKPEKKSNQSGRTGRDTRRTESKSRNRKFIDSMGF